jgi:hypothetical protein
MAVTRSWPVLVVHRLDFTAPPRPLGKVTKARVLLGADFPRIVNTIPAIPDESCFRRCVIQGYRLSLISPSSKPIVVHQSLKLFISDNFKDKKEQMKKRRYHDGR